MKNSTKGLLCVLLAYVPLGMSYPIAGAIMDTMPVFLFTCISMLIASIIAIPLAKIKEPELKWKSISGKNWVKIILQSLIGTMMFTTLNLYGLKYCDPVLASVITSVSPALTLVASIIFLKEKVNFRKVLGVVFAVAAIILMTVDFSSAGSITSNPIGIILVFLSVICQVVYFLLAKQISYDMPPYSMTAALVAPSFVMLIPFAIFDITRYDLGVLSGTDWLIMVGYGIAVGYICYLFTYKAFKYVSASYFSTGAAIVPVVTFIISLIFYNSGFQWNNVVGVALVVISIVVLANPAVGDNDVVIAGDEETADRLETMEEIAEEAAKIEKSAAETEKPSKSLKESVD